MNGTRSTRDGADGGPTISPADQLAFRVAAAAKALSISPRTLYSLTYPRGPIKVARVGSALLYSRAELERFLADAIAQSTGENIQREEGTK